MDQTRRAGLSSLRLEHLLLEVLAVAKVVLLDWHASKAIGSVLVEAHGHLVAHVLAIVDHAVLDEDARVTVSIVRAGHLI